MLLRVCVCACACVCMHRFKGTTECSEHRDPTKSPLNRGVQLYPFMCMRVIYVCMHCVQTCARSSALTGKEVQIDACVKRGKTGSISENQMGL